MELSLITNNPTLANLAEEAGIDRIFIDWNVSARLSVSLGVVCSSQTIVSMTFHESERRCIWRS